MYSKLVLSAIFIVSALSVAEIQAAPGSKGKDYDEKTIRVKDGSVVEVIAVCTTRNTQPGNTSSVVAFQNDVEVGRDGGDRYSS